MADPRSTIRDLLSQAMRDAMHPPQQHFEPDPDYVSSAPARPKRVSALPQHVDFPDSWIESLDYDEAKHELVISMKGTPYSYPDVSKDVFDEFSKADDPGDYYHTEFHPYYHSR